MKSFFVLITVVLSGVFAKADRVGNGGGLWACQAPDMTSGMLVDLYEAREEFGVPLAIPMSQDPMLIADEIMARLNAEWPDFGRKIQTSMDEVLRTRRFVDSVLVKIDDSLFRMIPHPRLCPGGKWEYVQFANFTEQNQVLISRELWMNPAIPALDKAALLWHEAIYRWMRTENGDHDSVRSRQIVGSLFASWPMSKIREEIQKVLKPKPASQGFICLMRNQMTNLTSSGYGDTEDEAQSETRMSCQSGDQPFFCQDQNLKCDSFSEGPPAWFCEIRNQLTWKLFSGKGRSNIEAEIATRKSCEEAGQPFHCQDQSLRCSLR